MASSVPMENATADATAVAERLQRARDELRVAQDVLENLGKQGQAMALALPSRGPRLILGARGM